jgi:hypothetical protein
MAVDRRDPPEVVFLPLFEALSWAARLIDSREYDQVEVAQGLRWARNGVRLHWARALESRGAVVPCPVLDDEGTEVVGHTIAIEWFWRPVERMPKPRASKHESEQREAYRTHFAGRSAQEPLCGLLEDLAPSVLARR